MIIDIKDTLTLDDNKDYVVVSKIEYQNQVYFYLTDVDNTDVKFYFQKRIDELTELEDQELIKTLLPLFIEEAKKQCTPEELKIMSAAINVVATEE